MEEAWGTHLHAANLGCRVIRLIAVFRLNFITRRATTATNTHTQHTHTHTLVKPWGRGDAARGGTSKVHVRVLPESADGSGEVVLDTQGGTATAVPRFLHGHGEHGLEFVVLLLGFLHVQHHVEVLLFLGRHRRRVVIVIVLVLVVIATTPPGACSIGRVVGSSLVTIAGPIVTTVIIIVLVIILVVVIVAVVAGGVRGVRRTVVVACGAAGFGVSCGSFRSCGSLSSGGCSIVLPGFAPCSL